jgi:hypothetical protein
VGPSIWGHNKITLTEKKLNNITRGILEIGFCPNGDRVVIELKSLAVLYWSHDQSPNWDCKQISECVPCFRHLTHLLLGIYNDSFIPWDSYAASEYYDKIIKLNSLD